MLNVSIYLLLGLLVITAILMVLIVLMQRPKNEGLGASFGGGMTQDLFGAQTTNVLQKFTVYLGAIFFGSCLILTVLYSKQSTKTSPIQQKLAAAAAARKATIAASPTPMASKTPLSAPVASATPVVETPALAPATSSPALETTVPTSIPVTTPAEASVPVPVAAEPIVTPASAESPAPTAEPSVTP